MSININVKTKYSFLSSNIDINYPKNLKGFNFKCAAICDDSVLFGAKSFYDFCVSNNIKPIIGMEIAYIFLNEYKIQLLLYVKNNEGYKNLLNIANIVNGGKSNITLDNLQTYASGLICVIPSDNEIFKDDKYKAIIEKFILLFNQKFAKIYFGSFRFFGYDDLQLDECKKYFNKFGNRKSVV